MTTKKKPSSLVRSTKTNLAKKPTSVLPSKQVIDGAAVLVEIANKWIEYRQIVQEEETKREEIRANAAVALGQIKARRDVMMKLLDDEHRERAEVFKSLFRNLEEALNRNEMRHATAVVELITDLAHQSPIKVLADTHVFRGALQDPNGANFSF